MPFAANLPHSKAKVIERGSHYDLTSNIFTIMLEEVNEFLFFVRFVNSLFINYPKLIGLREKRVVIFCFNEPLNVIIGNSCRAICNMVFYFESNITE